MYLPPPPAGAGGGAAGSGSGSGWYRDGSGWYRDGSGWYRDGSGWYRDGSGASAQRVFGAWSGTVNVRYHLDFLKTVFLKHKYKYDNKDLTTFQ